MPIFSAMLIAATLSAASDPAPRQPGDAPLSAIAITTVAAGATATIAPADQPDQVYCIRDTFPDSMTERQRCRRLADWQARAIDPRTMPRVR